MQVSRLSLLVELLTIWVFFVCLSFSLLLFSPFSVRCILLTCHVPSILAARLLPSICLASFSFSLAQINLAYNYFFPIHAYTNMQIIVYVNMHIYMYICVCRYLEWVLAYNHVMWTAMHKTIPNVIIHHVLLSSCSICFLNFL